MKYLFLLCLLAFSSPSSEAQGMFTTGFTQYTAPVVSTGPFRYWRFQTTGTGSDNQGNSVSEFKFYYNTTWNLMTGITVTNLGGAFHASYPMAKVNDGTAEITNASSMGHVVKANGNLDVYFDLVTAQTVTGVQVAPQGIQNSIVYNTPLAITVYGSNNASTWTQVFTVSSITVAYPNWNAGTYRQWTW